MRNCIQIPEGPLKLNSTHVTCMEYPVGDSGSQMIVIVVTLDYEIYSRLYRQLHPYMANAPVVPRFDGPT